eukprot:scaffold2094_cov146-Amphora_coffeaeformis.AAC.2
MVVQKAASLSLHRLMVRVERESSVTTWFRSRKCGLVLARVLPDRLQGELWHERADETQKALIVELGVF